MREVSAQDVTSSLETGPENLKRPENRAFASIGWLARFWCYNN